MEINFRRMEGGFESPLDGFLYQVRNGGVSPDKVSIVVNLVSGQDKRPQFYECVYQAYHHEKFIRDDLVSMQPDQNLLEDFLKQEELVAQRENITLEIIK
jgi:hypothetical protein